MLSVDVGGPELGGLLDCVTLAGASRERAVTERKMEAYVGTRNGICRIYLNSRKLSIC